MRTSRVCRICTLDCSTTLSGWPCGNTLECPIAPAYLNRPDARFQDQMLVFKIDTPYFAVSPGRLITTPPFVKGAIVWSTYLNMLKIVVRMSRDFSKSIRGLYKRVVNQWSRNFWQYTEMPRLTLRYCMWMQVQTTRFCEAEQRTRPMRHFRSQHPVSTGFHMLKRSKFCWYNNFRPVFVGVTVTPSRERGPDGLKQ